MTSDCNHWRTLAKERLNVLEASSTHPSHSSRATGGREEWWLSSGPSSQTHLQHETFWWLYFGAIQHELCSSSCLVAVFKDWPCLPPSELYTSWCTYLHIAQPWSPSTKVTDTCLQALELLVESHGSLSSALCYSVEVWVSHSIVLDGNAGNMVSSWFFFSPADFYSIEQRKGDLPLQRHACAVHAVTLQSSKKNIY